MNNRTAQTGRTNRYGGVKTLMNYRRMVVGVSAAEEENSFRLSLECGHDKLHKSRTGKIPKGVECWSCYNAERP